MSDPNPDVKIATENVLADFLREIKHIARVQARHDGYGHSENVPPTGRSTGYASGYGHGRRVSDVHGSSAGVGGYPLRRRGSKLTMNTDTSEIDSNYAGTGTTGGDGERDRDMTSPDGGHLDDLREEDEEAHHRAKHHRYINEGDGEVGNNSMMTSQDAEEDDEEDDLEEHGAWIPGQGVYVDHAAIIDIMVQHLSYPGQFFFGQLVLRTRL